MTRLARGPRDPDIPRNGLISALHLATMWDLNDVRQLQFSIWRGFQMIIPTLKIRCYAIARLDTMPMTSLEKVILAKQEMVQSWLLSGYEELVGVQNLSLQEIDVLDWETIAKLFFVQKQISPPAQCGRANHVVHEYHNCCGCNITTTCCIKGVRQVRKAHELIREVFEVELKGMDAA